MTMSGMNTLTRRPAEFKRGMHQTNNDILWFGNERRVITYLLVLMHANTRNKFRNQCEQKYCCGMENRCIGKRKVDTRLNLVVKHAAVAVRLVAIYVHMWDTKSFFRRVAKNDQD